MINIQYLWILRLLILLSGGFFCVYSNKLTTLKKGGKENLHFSLLKRFYHTILWKMYKYKTRVIFQKSPILQLYIID